MARADFCQAFARLSVSPLLLAAVAMLWAGCGASTTAPQVPAGPITVTGSEHLAWDQASADGVVSSYSYVAYIDGSQRQPLDSSCQSSSDGSQAQCLAPLPRMTVGTHALQLATVVTLLGIERESPPSAALELLVTGSTSSTTSSTTSSAGSRLPMVAADGTRFVAHTLATGLDRSSAVAVLPDGRVLIAEIWGAVRVWEDGTLLAEPALLLTDAAAGSDVGSIDLTLDPQFEVNHHVFVSYVARAHGEFVNRLVRYREVAGELGEPAVLLEDRASAPPSVPTRVRFGPDGKLYVAFPPSDRTEANDPSMYSGKILRLNDDGTTPADNPGGSPIVSSGDLAASTFDWQPGTDRPWLAERLWDGRGVLEAGLSRGTVTYVFDSSVDPAAAVFYRGAMSGFTGDLLIATLDGRHLRRVRFDPDQPTRIVGTEPMLDGEFGRLSDVVIGPDGLVYLCTSNPQQGSLASKNDVLVRLEPMSPSTGEPGER